MRLSHCQRPQHLVSSLSKYNPKEKKKPKQKPPPSLNSVSIVVLCLICTETQKLAFLSRHLNPRRNVLNVIRVVTSRSVEGLPAHRCSWC